ncbi:MAG: phosphate propanoyltransferase [Oscillospiraceae bacterium]|nr:phosphate propanoyltransferase [Oscillospiraceae bacterium]MBQ4643988.1 phosphate propanoyltransferase [Oscillospiraceae bacterium]
MSKTFIVETSARHVHLSAADLETLFGAGYELKFRKELSQPGQFATFDRVDIVGPKRTLSGVTILGPTRPQTQVELSLTDARSIGLTAPIRESGDLSGSAPCKIVGPCGEVELTEGVIIAMRHIHMLPEDAERLGVKDKEIVSVKIDSPERKTIFGDVLVRVTPTSALAMHIDTDEANAAGICGQEGEIVKI